MPALLSPCQAASGCVRPLRQMKDQIQTDCLRLQQSFDRLCLGIRRVSTTLRQVLTKFIEFFHLLGFPQRNFAPGSPRNNDRQLGRPTASSFLSLLKRISLFQNGSLWFPLRPPTGVSVR